MNKRDKKLELDAEEKKEAQKDLENYSALEAVANSKGGKLIIENLTKDIVNGISLICSKYKKASHVELIVACSDLSMNIDLLRTLTRAKKNKEDLRELLEEALQE